MRTWFQAQALAALGCVCVIICCPAFAQTPTPTPPAAAGPARPASAEYTGPKPISDAIIAEKAAALTAQSTGAVWKRSATLPEDWNYKLAPGVTTRQVSFYVDGGTRLQG
jgi:hypothetical protein